MNHRSFSIAFTVLSIAACKAQAVPEPADSKPASSAVASAVPHAGVLRLGQVIGDQAKPVSLKDVATDPAKFKAASFTTTGTVSAVCQHMGCWMEIKDTESEAHIKMAGHAFFVPKTASGKKARVLAKLVDAPGKAACGEEGAGHEKGQGCRAEAESQMGHPLAKLELEALGVEIVD